MTKGELTVGYVIAIVLGVIVLVLVGYWIFTQGGIFGGVASETTCQGKLYNYCTFWSICNYQAHCQPGGQEFYDANTDCEDFESKLQPSTAEGCRILLKQIEKPSEQPS